MQNSYQIEAVNKVYEYIKENISKEINLHDIAVVSGYSPWYISRVFKHHYGKNISEFIRAMRLSDAALSLRDTDSLVLDVALDNMFDTHEGFTRAFSKEFKISPKKYSKTTPPIKLFMPHPITEIIVTEDEENGEDAKVVFTQVIEKERRKAIIKRAKTAIGYFEYCEEVGCDIWGTLYSVKEALFEPVGMWLPEKLVLEDTSQYVQGVEVPFDYDGEVPEGYELIELDPCMTMIFQGPKYEDRNFVSEVGKVMKAINEFDPIPFGFEWADDESPRLQYEPRGERGYIEARAVRKID